MRKNFGAHASIYPQPVFILAAYGEDGTPCAMNAAWGGISDDQELSFCVSPSHRTVKDLLARGAFTVSMGTAEQVVACDYVGLVSGNQVPDKFARAGFHATKSEFVDAPCIDELPIAVSGAGNSSAASFSPAGRKKAAPLCLCIRWPRRLMCPSSG